MTILFRRLSIDCATDQGAYGAVVNFEAGLNVVRAGNSRGKSLCLNSIIYALGLEGMWSASRDVPLSHAVTSHLETAGGGTAHVLESSVTLEFENQAGRRMLVTRQIKGARSRSLVRVTTDGESSELGGQDYYVRESGGAQGAYGFHALFASFAGLDLPMVPRFGGGEGQLYLEALFPLFFVEQKQGWASIEGKFPGYLGIRDAAMRAVSFVLALDSAELARKRLALHAREQELVSKWERGVIEAKAAVRAVGGNVRGLPVRPTVVWPPKESPLVLVPQGDSWEELSGATERIKSLAVEATAGPEESVGVRAPEIEARLALAQEKLRALALTNREVAADLSRNERDVEATRRRIRSLEEDIKRHKDLRTLQRLGGELALKSASGACPTCSQAVSEPLARDMGAQNVMSVEDNLAFLTEELKALQFVRAEAESSLVAKRDRWAAISRAEADARAEIRSLKDVLTQSEKSPSLDRLADALRMKNQVEQLETARRAFEESLGRFGALAEEWAEFLANKADLPSSHESPQDTAKLNALAFSVREQLEDYGFSSVRPSEITVPSESLRLAHAEFDLQFDASASDTIRMAWAFRVALLEVSRRFQCNHLGVLLLDEPRQQEVQWESFGALLRRLTASKRSGQQVIVAASHSDEDVESALSGSTFNLISFPDRIIRPR